MLKPQQAELLANTLVQQYVNKCDCQTPEDVANALMKLASMCGLAMCAVVGRDESVARLQGTADYISSTEAGRNWRVERAN
jgi:hypothetical protein